ncbi:cytochrome d ubiquinol oxidase subunit II [Kitasatospora sp. DSM 101779]|uniref:cytochrome d ubiquinol oxidase subunit II n=1 Tax=Kitasatospora sp. DSM 101779 TaxID=2853165 RepID=UPI0021DB2819|nr:cytochrome d ubiquinol oxidase subunit II [Kitasatospora sp. DSM 101779]MCU7821024.1 cytochrome d ubiquinol oxidase subunit II [Kitasatospora sp. DSM 101779]
MALATFWFIVTATLWTGFFVLEGFDLGVGMLHTFVARDEAGRRAAINTIGPLWDGNEVWLIVAAAAMFAAFPSWYATMFSGFYPVLILLLVGLIVRGVSFEFRGKVDSTRWVRTWDVLLTVGSLLVPLLIGIALGGLLHGVPIDQSQEFTGDIADLFSGYAVFTGITLVLLCLLHGATFITLRTTGAVQDRALALARRIAPPTILAVLAFQPWTHSVAGGGVLPDVLELVAVLAVLAAGWLLAGRHEGWAFVATTVVIATTVLSFFADLYPRLMVSSTDSAFDLTVHNSASGGYALKVMSVVAIVFFPLVLAYQGWTYHVFRLRVSAEQFDVPDRGSG